MEFVKLEAPIQLVPKEYRILLAQIAIQQVCAFNNNDSTLFDRDAVCVSRDFLEQCGIVEALVPQQHQDELASTLGGNEL